MVRGERFRPLATERDTAAALRLTTVPPQSADAPESGEVSLAQYEGNAVIVRGVDEGGWIYASTVVEHAGLILTAVVQEVFAAGDVPHRLKYPLAEA